MTATEQSRRKPSRVYLRRGHPVTQGLRASWPTFAGAGQTLRDISGRQNHGAFNGDPTWTVTEQGRAIDLDGAGDWIDGTLSRFNIDNNLTYCIWIQTTVEADSLIMDNRDKNYDGAFLEYNFEGPGLPAFGVDLGSSTPPKAIGTTNVADGDLHQLVGTWNNNTNTAKIFVDGIEEDSSTETVGSQTEINDVLAIGEQSGGTTDGINSGTNHEFDGIVSNASVYQRDLSPGEVSALFSNPLLPFITKPR